MVYGAGFAKVADISNTLAGFSLPASTNDLCTWTAPNDGQVHTFIISATKHVTSNETGGQLVAVWTLPDGTASGSGVTVIAGGKSTGIYTGEVNGECEPNTTVTIHQQTSLSLGASVVWGRIFGQ